MSEPALDGNRSVHRAMQLLGMFSAERPSWTVGGLAAATGLHKSVVTRMMATMARSGFVVQDPASRSYSTGPKAFAVGSSYAPQEVLGTIARPVMRELTDRCGHATSVGVPAGQRFIYLLVNDSKLPVRVAAHVGEERDYHANAIGKVLLAGMSDAGIEEALGDGDLRRYTGHTVVDRARLMREIERIRSDRLAENREEAMVGVGALAVPIEDGRGAWVAALSVVYPIHLVGEGELRELSREVVGAGNRISEALSR